MALPQKYLVASTPALPQFAAKDGPLALGVDDPAYLMVLKQVGYT